MPTFDQLLLQLGAFAILLGAGFEGETAAVAGGILAHNGLIAPWQAVLATAAGAFIADEIFFLLGRRFRDRPFVQRARQRPTFARAVAFIERYPDGYILAFRFLYGLRVVSPIALGLTNVRYRRFAILNAIAALLWASVYTAIGYAFGPAFEAFLAMLAPWKTPILIALPIPGTCFILWQLWKWRQRRRHPVPESQPASEI